MKPCVGGGQSQSALWSASAGGVCSELWLLADVIALKGPKRAKVAEHAAQHAWHACDRLEDDEPVADRACWRVDSIVAGGKVEGVVRHAHGLLQHDVREALRHVLEVGRLHALLDLRLAPYVVLLSPRVVAEFLGDVDRFQRRCAHESGPAEGTAAQICAGDGRGSGPKGPERGGSHHLRRAV